MDLRLFNIERRIPASVIRMRCPACRHMARLEPLGGGDVDHEVVARNFSYLVGLGFRFCPNSECSQLIFVAYLNTDSGPALIYSAPAEALDFDSSGLPEKVLSALEEASKCYGAGCYVAAAIMLRKTLEEVCDERNATGPNLKSRIESLTGGIVLPQALIDGLQDLRLLGNDGAHVELKHFNDVGKEEVELAFDLVKEFLKALYQLQVLQERLAARKKAAATTP